MGTGRSFPGAKVRPGRDADHSSHLSCWGQEWVKAVSSPPCRVHGFRGTVLSGSERLKSSLNLSWGKFKPVPLPICRH